MAFILMPLMLISPLFSIEIIDVIFRRFSLTLLMISRRFAADCFFAAAAA